LIFLNSLVLAFFCKKTWKESLLEEEVAVFTLIKQKERIGGRDYAKRPSAHGPVEAYKEETS
jgi:predicted LPLAT superfamily acyltransferase